MLLADIDKRTRQLASVVLVWMGIIAGSIFLYLFDPSIPSNQIFFPACPFRLLTGLNCPGCGTTRGLHHLLHGDLLGAFQLNPLMFLLLPILLYALVRHTKAVFRDQPIQGNQLKPGYIWMFFAVVMSFWIFRNTSYYPFVS